MTKTVENILKNLNIILIGFYLTFIFILIIPIFIFQIDVGYVAKYEDGWWFGDGWEHANELERKEGPGSWSSYDGPADSQYSYLLSDSHNIYILLPIVLIGIISMLTLLFKYINNKISSLVQTQSTDWLFFLLSPTIFVAIVIYFAFDSVNVIDSARRNFGLGPIADNIIGRADIALGFYLIISIGLSILFMSTIHFGHKIIGAQAHQYCIICRYWYAQRR